MSYAVPSRDDHQRQTFGEDSFKNALSSEHYIENFISRYATSYVQDNWKKEFEDIRDALTDRGGTKAEEILSYKTTFDFQAYESASISIIIPVYNKLSYTINCLDSILRCQEKSSFEVIVVDDGSTDNTSKCLALIPNIKVVAAEETWGSFPLVMPAQDMLRRVLMLP